MIYQEQPSCNRCKAQCRGNKIKNRYADLEVNCNRWVSPSGTFMLAELALAHPTSLNEALSVLPFDVNLNFFLK